MLALPREARLRELIDIDELAKAGGDFRQYPTLGEALKDKALFADPAVASYTAIVRAIITPTTASLWLVRITAGGDFAKLWDFQPSPDSRLFT